MAESHLVALAEDKTFQEEVRFQMIEKATQVVSKYDMGSLDAGQERDVVFARNHVFLNRVNMYLYSLSVLTNSSLQSAVGTKDDPAVALAAVKADGGGKSFAYAAQTETWNAFAL